VIPKLSRSQNQVFIVPTVTSEVSENKTGVFKQEPEVVNPATGLDPI
jgi:hypothetical protein